MTKLLYAAGTSFLRAFGAAFLVYALGILAAPDLASARSLSIAGLLASLAAALRAVQVFVSSISFSTILPQPYAAWVDSFSRAFLATLLISVTGWLASPDFGTWRAVGLAAVVGAVAAGIRAIQGLVTKGETPSPETGA